MNEHEIREAWGRMFIDWYGYVLDDAFELSDVDETSYRLFRRGWLAAKGYKYD